MIAEILSKGEANAKSSKYICGLLGLNLRDLTQRIMQERRAGEPICSTTGGAVKGYFLAANKGEMTRFCSGLAKRAKEIFKTRAACLKTLDKLPSTEGGGSE